MQTSYRIFKSIALLSALLLSDCLATQRLNFCLRELAESTTSFENTIPPGKILDVIKLTPALEVVKSSETLYLRVLSGDNSFYASIFQLDEGDVLQLIPGRRDISGLERVQETISLIAILNDFAVAVITPNSVYTGILLIGPFTVQLSGATQEVFPSVRNAKEERCTSCGGYARYLVSGSHEVLEVLYLNDSPYCKTCFDDLTQSAEISWVKGYSRVNVGEVVSVPGTAYTEGQRKGRKHIK